MTKEQENEFTEIIKDAIAPASGEICGWFHARGKIMAFVREHDLTPEQLRAIWKRLYRHLKGVDDQMDLFGDAS